MVSDDCWNVYLGDLETRGSSGFVQPYGPRHLMRR